MKSTTPTLLESLDKRWLDHIEIMQIEKDLVQWVSCAHRDPATRYRQIGTELSRHLYQKIRKDIIKIAL